MAWLGRGCSGDAALGSGAVVINRKAWEDVDAVKPKLSIGDGFQGLLGHFVCKAHCWQSSPGGNGALQKKPGTIHM